MSQELTGGQRSVDHDKPVPIRLPAGDQRRPNVRFCAGAGGINRRHGPPGTNEGEIASLNNFRIVEHETRPLSQELVTMDASISCPSRV